MRIKSGSQRRRLFAMAGRGEIGYRKVHSAAEKVKGRKLPERARKKRRK